MRGLIGVSCIALAVACGANRSTWACPAVAVGGCASTAVGAVGLAATPVYVTAPVVVVPSVVTTFAVPTFVAAPVFVQQTIVRQRPIRVRSRTVIRSRSSGLGIF